MTTYRNILAGRVEWPWWLYFFGSSRSVLQGLLAPDPVERLGSQSTRDVTNHVFFATIGLETLEMKRTVTAATRTRREHRREHRLSTAEHRHEHR